MKRFFINKKIIVTGGASGIGACLVRMLTSFGAQVVVIDRANQVNQNDCLQADLADSNQAEQAFSAALAKLGGLDIVINSAGIFMGGEIANTPMKNWKKVIDNNIYAVSTMSHLAYQYMTKQHNGHIVNVASTAGLIPVPAMGIYGATKYALVGLSHAMRIEGAGLGVKVSVACPTVVNTPLYDTAIYNNVDKKQFLWLRSKLQSPERAANAIIRAIYCNKATIHTSYVTYIAWVLYRLFPAIYNAIARKIIRKYRSSIKDSPNQM